MNEQITHSLKMYFEAHIAKHKMNIQVMMNNPMAIHEHTDLMTAIEEELAHVAEYMDKLEALELVTA